jgi:hypothetical protein
MSTIQQDKLLGIRRTLPQIPEPGSHGSAALKYSRGATEPESRRIKVKAEGRKAEAFKIVRHSTFT